VCAAAQARAAPLVARVASAVPSLTARDTRDLAPVLRRLEDVEADALARLRELDRPEGEDAAIQRWLQPATRVVAALREAGQALGQGDAVGALLVLQRSQSVAGEASAAARDYGVARCAALVSGRP